MAYGGCEVMRQENKIQKIRVEEGSLMQKQQECQEYMIISP